MGTPLTTEDLYGSSPSSGDSDKPEKPLVYEETPVIDPIVADAHPSDSVVSSDGAESTHGNQDSGDAPKLSPPHDLPRMPNAPLPRSSSHVLLNMVAFILLFVAGIWLSSALRPYLPAGLSESLGLAPISPTAKPTPSAPATVISPTPAGMIGWKSYDVISGTTRKPMPGISFQLPTDILPPICDGSGCASQGTYLPGGTRFTVAARGTGQLLRDYRGTTISDVNGIAFTTKAVTIAGKPSMEYTGTFTGRTISGYAFTSMRGVMVPLSDTTSVEFNHFVPSGIVANFQTDDIIFDEILKRVVLSGLDQTQKGANLLSPTVSLTASPSPTYKVSVTPTPTRIATQSGSPTSTKLP